MSNSSGSANGRLPSSGPERPTKSISQRVKSAFSILGRLSSRRRSIGVQAQVKASPSSSQEFSVSDAEVESYLSIVSGSAPTDASSDGDAASSPPAELITLSQNSGVAQSTSRSDISQPASSTTPDSGAVETFPTASPSKRVASPTSALASASNPPSTQPILPVHDPLKPRSYGAFKKDKAPLLPHGYHGVMARLPPGFQRSTSNGLVRQNAYEDIENRLRRHGLRREPTVHEDTHPSLRSPLREEWWVYTHIYSADRGHSSEDDSSSSSDDGSSPPTSPRSEPKRTAPSPPSPRARRPPTPGPSSSPGQSHSVSGEDGQGSRAASRRSRQYTPYPFPGTALFYPSASIYRSPNPDFVRSRVEGNREQGSPREAVDVGEDTNMGEPEHDSGEKGEQGQDAADEVQKRPPSIPLWLLEETDRMFVRTSEVERPIYRESSPTPLLETVDNLDSTSALPVFSAYPQPFVAPWSTTTVHLPPPGPNVVYYYPDIEFPDHSSMVLKDLESNADLPFDVTLPPIRNVDPSTVAGPSQERLPSLPSLFYPEFSSLSDYVHLPRQVLEQMRPIPEPYISTGKDVGPPKYILDRTPPPLHDFHLQVPFSSLPSLPPSPSAAEFHGNASRDAIVPGGALGLTGCRRRKFEEEEPALPPCHAREDCSITQQRSVKRQKVEHRAEGLAFESDRLLAAIASASIAGRSCRSRLSEPTPLRRSARISAARAKQESASVKGKGKGKEVKREAID